MQPKDIHTIKSNSARVLQRVPPHQQKADSQVHQLPNLTPDQHFCALTEELAKETATANNTPTGRRLIKILQNKIKQIVEQPALIMKQEANEQEQKVRMQQQRVIDETPILIIPHIMNVPPIMQS